MRVTLIAIAIYIYICVGVAMAGPKKIKVYLDYPDQGLCESFSRYIWTWMRSFDEDDKSYQFVWVEKAEDAEFIITTIMIKNSVPSIIGKDREGKDRTCYQYVTDVQLWKKNSEKTHEWINLQSNCDPNEIARRAVTDMLKSMGLVRPDSLTRK